MVICFPWDHKPVWAQTLGFICMAGCVEVNAQGPPEPHSVWTKPAPTWQEQPERWALSGTVCGAEIQVLALSMVTPPCKSWACASFPVVLSMVPTLGGSALMFCHCHCPWSWNSIAQLNVLWDFRQRCTEKQFLKQWRKYLDLLLHYECPAV